MANRTKEQRIADRAAAREKSGQALSNRQIKNAAGQTAKPKPKPKPTPSPSPSPSPSKPKVAEVRAAAKEQGVRIRDYKAANNIAPNSGGADRRANATQTKGNISKYDANSVGKSSGGKYTHQDIKALKDQGYSYDDIGKHLQESGADNLGNRATTLRDRYINSLTAPKPTPSPTPAPTPTTPKPSPAPTPTYPTPTNPYPQPSPSPSPSPSPVNPGPGTGDVSIPGVGIGITGPGDNDAIVNNPDNSMDLIVDQDNDINTNIDGNNNTVVNTQDNSIRQYGGDNRSFNYIGGGGGSGFEDTPVSAATMAGFYDVDDSPAAQAKFNDLHTTLNRDNQKRYAGMGLTTASMFDKYDARSYTDESMTNAVARSTQNSYDRADVQTGITLGDIWRPDYAPNWRMPDKPSTIDNNIEGLTEDIKDDLDDV